MKKIFIAVTALVLLQTAGASPEMIGQYGFNKYEESETVVLYGDKVNVRDKASVDGKVIAQLPIASEVNIIGVDEGNYLEQNGYREEWYKVEYTGSDGKTGEGYIWGGLISKTAYIGDIMGKKKVTVLVGVTSIKEYNLYINVRLVQNGKIIAESGDLPAFVNPLFDTSVLGHTVAIKVVDDAVFTPTAKPIVIGFDYGACDCPYGEVIVLYDGKKLYYVTTAMGVGNEMGGFDYEVTYPDGKKLKNTIKIDTTTIELDEEGNEVSNKKKSESYQWTGSGTKQVK
ncbi:MAG: SH3 domain-containing protein [Brevinematales bacterium]|nr:SH3 domain-containing protein [Brevinematales bacterium]